MEIEGIELKKAPFYAQHIGTPHSSYTATHEVVPLRSRPGMSLVAVDGYNYDYMPQNKYKPYTGKPISIGIFNRKAFNPDAKKNNYVAVIKDFGYGIMDGKSLTDLVKSTNAYLDTNSDIVDVYDADGRMSAIKKEVQSLFKSDPKTFAKGAKPTSVVKSVKATEKKETKAKPNAKKPLVKTVKATKKLTGPKKPRISWKMGAIPTKNGADRALWVVVEEKGGKWTANFTGNPPVGREKDNHAPFAVDPSVKLNGSEIPPEVKVQLGMFSTKFNPNGVPIFKKIDNYVPKRKFKMPKQPKINKASRKIK